MQQILTLLSSGADPARIASVLSDNSGGFHAYLSPTVLIVDGDVTVQNALISLIPDSVVGTLSDDDAKILTTVVDISQLDIPGMVTLFSTSLGFNFSPDESTILAMSGWIYGLSQQYAARKSDRPREGETWDMEGGCLPSDIEIA